LFFAFYGAVGFYFISETKITVIYLLLLILQCCLARQAARNYGFRFVTTVMSQKVSTSETNDRKKNVMRKGAS
jgi:hypothetical protein